MPAAVAFTVVFGASFFYQGAYASDESESAFYTDDENTSSYSDMFTDDETLAEQELLKEQEKEEAENEPVEFITEIVNTSDETGGSIKVTVKNGTEDDVYYCSFNGGKSFRKMSGRSVRMNDLDEGSYSICLKKNNNNKTLSKIKTVYVSSEENTYPIEISLESTKEYIYKDAVLKICIENYNKEKNYELSIDGGESFYSFKEKVARIKNITGKEYSVIVREKDNIENCSNTLTVNLKGISYSKKASIDAPMILQNPELPTGCEITSLTMLLNFLGFDADKITMAEDYLPKGEYRNSDFRKVFVGNPKNTHAFGCYSPAIVTAAEDYLEDMGREDNYTVTELTGCGVDSLYSAVDKGYPVIVWATMSMSTPTRGASWTIKKTGERVTWVAGEHCLLLTGYDKNKVYMNDPLVGKVSYSRATFEKRFKSLGKQAVIIVPNE